MTERSMKCQIHALIMCSCNYAIPVPIPETRTSRKVSGGIAFAHAGLKLNLIPFSLLLSNMSFSRAHLISIQQSHPKGTMIGKYKEVRKNKGNKVLNNIHTCTKHLTSIDPTSIF